MVKLNIRHRPDAEVARSYSLFMKKTSILITALFFAFAALSFARTWTQSATGKTIVAEFAGVSGTNVKLKSSGREYAVPIASLSLDDQAFIKEQLAKGAGSSSGAGGWPQWRGVNQDGISPETGILKEWPKGGPSKLWTYDDAGLGYSSFSFADGKLFTLGTRGGDLFVIALDEQTGKEAWSTEIGNDDARGYNAGWGGGPRSTPTYSDGHLYVLGPKGTLACLSAADGKEKWSKNLDSDFSGRSGGWGYSESPLIDGNKVMIAPGGDQSSIIALDKMTGESIWETDISGAGPAEYATILVTEIEGTRQYIKFFEKLLVGVDAESGAMIWSSEWPRGRTAVIPTPIVFGNEVYITSGYGAGSKKVRIEDGRAVDVWDNTDMKNHHGGVVKVGGYLYGFSDGGGLVCQSWETGDVVWNEKNQFTQKGALHVVDGMMICVNESDGAVLLVEVTPEGYNEKGQFILEDQSPNRNPQGKIWSHPVVINGKLFLRDQELITAFNVKR